MNEDQELLENRQQAGSCAQIKPGALLAKFTDLRAFRDSEDKEGSSGESVARKFEKAIVYLKSLRDPAEINKNSQTTVVAFRYLNHHLTKSKYKSVDLIRKHGLIEFVVNLVSHEYQCISQYLKAERESNLAQCSFMQCNCLSGSSADKSVGSEKHLVAKHVNCKYRIVSKENKTFLILMDSALSLLLHFSYNSIEFCLDFQSNARNMTVVFALLNDQLWTSKMTREPNRFLSFQIKEILYKNVSLIYRLGKTSHLNSSAWNECKPIVSLLSFAEAMTVEPECMRRALTTIKIIYDYQSPAKEDEGANDYFEFSPDSFTSQECDKVLESLSNFKDPAAILTSRKCRDAIIYLLNARKTTIYDRLNESSQKTLVDTFIIIMCYASDKMTEFFETLNQNTESRTKSIEERAGIIKISSFLKDVCEVVRCYSRNSRKFCSEFLQDGKILESILALISNQHLGDFFAKSTEKNILYLIVKSQIDASEEIISLLFEYDFGADEKWTLFSDEFQLNQDNLQKLDLGIKYIQKYKIDKDANISENILEDQNVLTILAFLETSTVIEGFVRLPEASIKSFVEFLSDFFCFIYQRIMAIFSNLGQTLSASSMLKFIKLGYLYKSVLSIASGASNVSVVVCSLFNQCPKFLDTLMTNLKDQVFLDYVVGGSKQSLLSYLVCNCYKVCLRTLQHLSRVASKFKDKWNSCDAVQVLLDLAGKLSVAGKDDFAQLAIYLTIANVAADDDINKLSELRNVAKSIAEKITACANMMADTIELNENSQEEEKSLISRIQVQLEEYAQETHQICLIPNSSWHLVELMKSLYHFAINDSIKQFIYYESNMKKSLGKLLAYGNEIEIEYSLLLLYQLCFDKKIASDVANTNALYEKIGAVKSSREGLKKSRDGIIWLCQGKDAKEKSEKDAANNDQHIMISYNSQSRDYCMQIKSGLEEKNYKVWIDVQNITGSALDSMARAIENAWCVIIVMTEKYKASANCRLEAEYCVNLGKPFIPVIAQEKYRPDGWLGIILGSKIFVDVTKYDLSKCLAKIVKELVNIRQENSRPNEPRKRTSEYASERSAEKRLRKQTSNALNWTVDRVNEWSGSFQMNQPLKQALLPCNGEILFQYYKIYKKTPDFFLGKLSKDSGCELSLKDLATFLHHLEKLFE